MLFDVVLDTLQTYKNIINNPIGNFFYMYLKFNPIYLRFITKLAIRGFEKELDKCKSIEVLLYEYALFLDMLKCKYDYVSDSKQGFRIRYSKRSKLLFNSVKYTYINRIICDIINYESDKIKIECFYEINNMGKDTYDNIGYKISFKDSNAEYHINQIRISSIYWELYEYIKYNILKDSELIYKNYIMRTL